jgi:hypothetical protein
MKVKRIRALLAIILIGVLLLWGIVAAVSRAQAQDCRFFDESGHYVCDEFLEFYTERGDLAIFGYPLTDAYDDPGLGLRVQYFQRARFELHPDNPPPHTVQLGLLVDELGYIYPPVSQGEIPIVPDPNHQYFPETGHVVSHAFLKYFHEKGGADIFGYPRSELLYEAGSYVQYFQRSRMEWRPEDTAGRQVRLTNIGEVYTGRFEIDTASLIGESRSLAVTASVRHVIVGQQDTQTVFVYVVNQLERPVEGVFVKGDIYQNNELVEHSCTFPETDSEGFTKCDFDFAPPQPGQKVVVAITASGDGLTGEAQTFFFPWW